VYRKDVIEVMEEHGSFVIGEVDRMKIESPELLDEVVSTIADFGLALLNGISSISIERDIGNNATEKTPPVLPKDLVKMKPREFDAIMSKQSVRLRQFFSDAEIFKIEEQFAELKLAFRGNTLMKKLIHESSGIHSFEESWQVLGDDYEILQEFCGDIASVLPSTASVEADFSLINWTKDAYSRSMTDFSLESILHCKQQARLTALTGE
jgi:hypothetical protein